jgi:hypothetical protein
MIMDNKKTEFESKLNNCIKANLLNAGVCSYKIDEIAKQFTQDIITIIIQELLDES